MNADFLTTAVAAKAERHIFIPEMCPVAEQVQRAETQIAGKVE